MNSRKVLSDVLSRDGNNFDILRLVAALGVIIGHSYAIAPQAPYTDGVLKLLHFDYSGSLAVKFFFFLSGLLVTNSIISRPEPFPFLVKRAFRIFPALLVCLLICVFIVGPIFTTLSLGEYFSAADTWRYIKNNFLLIDIIWRLPGVFAGSPYGLNGSLWTLPYEVLCYIYLAVIFGLGFLKNRIVANLFFIAVILISFVLPAYLPGMFFDNPEAHLLPGCFALGALFASNKKYIVVELSHVVLIWILVLLLKSTAAYQFLFYVAFFYSCLYVSSIPYVIRKLKLPFDASYGVYIYGFVIQQCLHHLFPAMGVHVNQLVASILAIGMGIMSWYLIEKRAIAYGHKVAAMDWRASFSRLISATGKEGSTGSIWERLSSKPWVSLILLTILAGLVHAIVLRFIFPGYYSPLYPQHSDFYIPAMFANSGDSYAGLMGWPRPVSIMFSKLIGATGIHGSIACVILMVCLNCAIAALLLSRIMKIRIGLMFYVAFLAYCYLVFSQPYFYTFYAQDIGAQLSFFFLIVGAFVFYGTRGWPIWIQNLLLFVFSLLAFLSKETYGLTALAVAAAWFFYHRKTSVWRGVLPAISILAALLLAFFINMRSQSVFVDPNATADSPYHISLNPLVIFKEWFKYAKEAINLANFALLAMLIYVFSGIRHEKKYQFLFITITCIVGFMVALVPNAVLPNHHYRGYSFNGIYLLYLPLLCLALIVTGKYLRTGVWILLGILCLISPLLNSKKYKDNDWVIAMENTQRNLLQSLEPLIAKVQPSEKPRRILIQGITFPFHPFAFPQALRVYPNARYLHFDVISYNPAFKNNQPIDLVTFIDSTDSAKANYDQKWVFDNDGRLVSSENVLVKNLFTATSGNDSILLVDKSTRSEFKVAGFYDYENGISWTDGNASIDVMPGMMKADSLFVELNTYMPPICAKVNPRVILTRTDGSVIQASESTRKDNMFYYLFAIKKEDDINRIGIQSENIDASPDKRKLSFPFIDLKVRRKQN